MAVTYVGFGPTVLTTSNVALYTIPSTASFRLESFTVSNTTAGSVTFTIGINGVTAADSLFYQVSINANSTVTWDGKIYLPASVTINGLASANTSLNIFGYGVLIS